MPASDPAANLTVKPTRKPFFFTAPGISLLLTIVVFAAAFGIYYLFLWLYGGHVDQFNLRNETLKTALQMFAGFFFVITALFSLRTVKATEANARAANRNAEAANENARVANENAKTAAENLRVAQQKLDLDRQTATDTLKANEAKHATERFFKATENLDSKNLSTRIGAIYTLERIAHESPEEHGNIFNVLAAFLSHTTSLARMKDHDGTCLDEALFDHAAIINNFSYSPDTDVLTALTVIGRRHAENDKNLNIPLVGCYMARMIFTNRDYGFRKPCFNNVNFARCFLVGAIASECQFDSASFFMADLTGAKLAKSNFNGANFASSNLTDANLRNADLTNVDFRKANLSGTKVSGAILYLADLSGADLYGCIGLTQEQANNVFHDEATKFPPYVEKPAKFEGQIVINGKIV